MVPSFVKQRGTFLHSHLNASVSNDVRQHVPCKSNHWRQDLNYDKKHDDKNSPYYPLVRHIGCHQSAAASAAESERVPFPEG